jgi:two-component system, OmpR family, response regulator MprA
MRETILVVDDEPAIVDLLCDVLDDAGYHAVAAHDGAEALTTVLEMEPDVVLSDVAMPEMNGLELADRLISMGVPVVLMSAAVSAPADPTIPFLAKPFEVDEVLDAVAALVQPAALDD